MYWWPTQQPQFMYLFFTVLQAGELKVKELEDLVSCEGLCLGVPAVI